MAVTVIYKGVTYTVPGPGGTDDWGASLTAFLQALAGNQVTTAVAGAASGSAAGVTGTSAIAAIPAVKGTSSNNGPGVLAEGGASGIGLQATAAGTALVAASTGGYGAVISGDATTPAKAALKLSPQDAEPTGPNAVGDMYVTTAGVLKICTVLGSPGTWVSVGAQT